MANEEEIVVIENGDTEEVAILESDETTEIVPIAEDIPVYDKNYLHVQAVASNEWHIIHNLNKYPSVTVFDSAGNECVGSVKYISLQELYINFSSGFAGKATLN